jgi:8-oxo-dGTP pyrophosphatase MutT (NUDIX family)
LTEAQEIARTSLSDEIIRWSSVASAAVAIMAVLIGFWVALAPYQTLALLNRRRRFIGSVSRAVGICSSRSRFLFSGWELLAARVRTGNPAVRDELAWLSGLRADRVIEAGLSPNHPVIVPFTFAPHMSADQYSGALDRLATAYDKYASSVRRRWLLRSAAGPLVAEEYECARSTAGLLRHWATFEPVLRHPDPDQMRGRLVTLASGQRPRSVRLVVWPDMAAVRATPAFPITGVSFQPYRVVTQGSPARYSSAAPTDVRTVVDVIGIAHSNPLDFDGVLARLHGPGFRTEVDRITGRQKLHLCLSETTYFAFRATQVPNAAAQAGDAAMSARLVGINLLAIDQEDVVLLTQRSGYVVYPGCYTGTVSGNCELVSREGLSADLDEYGLPDLLAAVIRETREEIGLDLKSYDSDLAALGIIEFSGEGELGTHALVATARLPGPAGDFRVERSAPDPVEGLWELGDHFMTVNLRAVLEDPSAGRRFILWLRSSQELAPQAAGSLLLLLTARLELRQQQAIRAARTLGVASAPSWTTRDLAQWLEMSLPAHPASVADLVGYTSLWK